MATAVEADVLLIDIEDGLATVTLNRPDAMNALNMDLKNALADAWRELARNAEVRAVMLTGAGRAFTAGGDIRQMDPDRGAEVTRVRMARLTHDVVIPLARLDVPVVAAVNGHAHGLGLGLVLACDVAFAARSAQMSMAFSKVGLGPDGCASYFLPRVVGLSRAKELLFTGRRLSAQEAADLGIVTEVVDDDQLLERATAFAKQLAGGPTVALTAAKRALNASSVSTLEQMAEIEAYGQAITMTSEDHREGIASFREKRPPAFAGK